MTESYDGEDGRASGGAGDRGPRRPGGGRGPRGQGRGRSGGSAAARLPEELRALGRSLGAAGADGPDGAAGPIGPETMAERVLAQILAERVPVPVAEPPGARERLRTVRRWTRLRWRSLTATLCGLLAVLALTPPVRAAVYDWFGFGGIEVRYDPSAVPSPGAEVPGCGRSLTLAQAGRQAGFEPLVPDALGVPDSVTVTDEPHGRLLLSMCWQERGGTVRLDEFPASLDPGFFKAVREAPEWIELHRAQAPDGLPDVALWFPQPHLLGFWLADGDGGRYRRQVRTAGPTLLWTHRAQPSAGTGDEGGAGSGGEGAGGSWGGEVTLRLEGADTRTRAVTIAQSLTALFRQAARHERPRGSERSGGASDTSSK
ncbi:hypothetical protein [Streptomyces sp. NPDC006012]|uniref:hypothetical protein n=1 Tax=Streptomyces sp. NPDC006012 TaxID=3364739 RepID=UPI0036888314